MEDWLVMDLLEFLLGVLGLKEVIFSLVYWLLWDLIRSWSLFQAVALDLPHFDC